MQSCGDDAIGHHFGWAINLADGLGDRQLQVQPENW